MAIQFRCPQCESLIRVPDAAAGQQGNCPQCGVAIVVPNVAVPPQASQLNSDSPVDVEVPIELADSGGGNPLPQVGEAAPLDDGHVGRASEPPVDEEPEFTSPSPQFDEQAAVDAGLPIPPFDPSAPAFTAAEPSIASRYKRRRRSGKNFIVPLVMIAIFLGVARYFYEGFRPKLEGQLRATVVNADQLKPTFIRPTNVAVSKTTFDAVVADLTQSPKRLRSEISITEFRGQRGSLELLISPGDAAELVRVDVLADPNLSQYLVENLDALAQPHVDKLESTQTAFFQEWEQSLTNDDLPAINLPGYRDDLVLNSLVGALGFHAVAVIGSQAYRCVFEDAEGRLYFLLPQGTRKFELAGRRISGDEPIFPGRYQVMVGKSK